MTTASIRNAIAALPPGGGTVAVPCGRYTVDSAADQIVAPPGVRLQAQGQVCYDYHAPGINAGVILEVNWGSGPGTSGNPAYAAVVMQAGSAIDGFGFDYPAQQPSVAAPHEWGASIHLHDPNRNAYGISVTNNYFFKSYIGCDARAASTGSTGLSNFTFAGNKGAPVYCGLAIDGVTDWVTIKDNNFNSGFIEPSYQSPLMKWSNQSGIARLVGGCDWLTMQNEQTFGYAFGAHVTGGQGYQGQGPYTFQNCSFDACWHGIELAGAIDGGARILGCTFAPFSPSINNPGCAVSVSASFLRSLEYADSKSFGPHYFDVYAPGPVDSVKVVNNEGLTSLAAGPAIHVPQARVGLIDGNTMSGFGSIIGGRGGAVVRNNFS